MSCDTRQVSSRSCVRSATSDVSILLRAPTFALAAVLSWASMWNPMSWANILNMPMTSGVFTRCGRGSIAQSVPKNLPSGIVIGIET